MKLALILLSFLITQSVHASRADCEEVDLNENSVLTEMGVNDQGETSTCYAHATAQLLEFKERSVGRKSSISPFDLALGYKADLTLLFNPLSKSYEAGMALSGQKKLFESAYLKGVASSECVEIAVEEFTKETNITPAQFIKILQEVSRSKNPFKNLGEEKESLKNNVYTCAHQPALDALEKAGLWAQNTTDILLEVLAPCVKQRRKIPPWPYQEDYTSPSGSTENLFKILDGALTKHMPAEAGLCAQILNKDQSYSPLKVSQRTGTQGSGVVDTCGGHAILVVGRKKIAGQCHYMIRNSWGKGWESPIGLTCGCRLPNGTYYKDCKVLEEQIASGILPKSLGEKKEVLGCWVSRENLEGNFRQVSALD